MSILVKIARLAIRWAPKGIVIWVSNKVLTGIATLKSYHFDLDTRKAYFNTLLAGEVEPIEVWLHDFGIMLEDGQYKVMLTQATSNKLWLNNIFSRITGKAFKIPVPPQYESKFNLVYQLFKMESPKGAAAEPAQLPQLLPKPEPKKDA